MGRIPTALKQPSALYGYCLLNNHFHLLLRPTGATISLIMQSHLVSHTQRYHRHYRSGGHADELVDSLVTCEEVSPLAKVRRRK